MFAHAWHYITGCTLLVGTVQKPVPAPYWMCAKCGAHTQWPPDQQGCPVER